jgi:hypothetical protein
LWQAALVAALLAGCARHSETAPGAAATAESRAAYPYHKPLFSPGALFGSLPLAVRNTVLAEAGDAEVSDVSKATNSVGVFYKVSFKQRVVYPPLYIREDGSVLHPDLTLAVQAPPPPVSGATTDLKLHDLPPLVQKALQDHAPDAEIARIDKEISGEHPLYAISFKHKERQCKLFITSDGTVLVEQPK